MTDELGIVLDEAIRLLETFNDSDEEKARQKAIVLARAYHEGDQGSELTSRLKEFIGVAPGSPAFSVNVVRGVVTAITEKLRVMGFDSDNAEVVRWAQKVWNFNKLEGFQDDLYENSIRDGENYIIVDWDAKAQLPTMTLNPRYTSKAAAGGDDFGVVVLYDENDYRQDIKVAIKRWIDKDEDDKEIRHMVVYTNDAVQKYEQIEGGDWTIAEDEELDEGEESVEDDTWTDNEGEPLGNAVIPFNNKKLRTEARIAFPLQDAVNKGVIDLLTSSDMTAFQIFIALGFIPTTDGKEPEADGSNWWTVEPGQIIGTTKTAKDTDFKAIQGADLAPQQSFVHQLIMWLASITDTPISRFISSKLISSDETLKQQDEPLLSKVRVRQGMYSSAWSRAFKLGIKLAQTYGTEGQFSGVDVDDLKLAPLWAESRGQLDLLDLLLKKQTLGVPTTQLLREAGYSEVQITEFEKADDNIQEESVGDDVDDNVDDTDQGEVIDGE